LALNSSAICVLVCLIAITGFISTPFVFFSVYAGNGQVLSGIPIIGESSELSQPNVENPPDSINFEPKF
jgi:hypothetical protein